MLIRTEVFLNLSLDKTLTFNDRRLVFLLLAYANRNYEINISFKEIADDLEIHVSTARRCIKNLMDKKIILKVKSNNYKLNPFYGWGNPLSEEVTEKVEKEFTLQSKEIVASQY